MLIIPVSSKISWKNPPVATIVIIVLNCLIFLLFQTNDNVKMGEAIKYYVSSGLSEIEAPLYIEYCKANSSEPSLEPEPSLENDKVDSSAGDTYAFALTIESDRKFLDLLHNEVIVTPHDPNYEKWKHARKTFESKLEKVVYWKYGFRPAFPSAVTLATYMFLHGGFFHLFGNMMFLWFMGCIIELGWGRVKYITLYLLSGISSVVLFGLVYCNSGTPLVGASGAIAGLMGAVTMLYARKKIKVFYSAGFYFGYITIRGWYLFPVWLGVEFYQLFFGGVSHVAYVGHIGGLIGGGTIGVIYRKWFAELYEDVLKEEEMDDISPMIEEALNHMSKLEMEEGREILEDVLKKDAQNKTALQHLFTIDKIHPDKVQFHETTKKLLHALSLDREDYTKVFEVYKEYSGLTRPKISPALYIRLASIFTSVGRLSHAEKIAKLLVEKKGDTPGIPELLFRISKKYQQGGQQEKFMQIDKLLKRNYPDAANQDIG
jgi:membrane associated rhomboid family serine protease